MEKNKKLLFKAICDEYDLVYQDLKNGVEIKIPTKENKTKKAFPVKGKANWGLTTGKPRKDGRLGDTTTKDRLEILANMGLFCKEDFQNYKGNLHKEVNYNDTDAKYIMQFLYERAVAKNPSLSFANVGTNINDSDDNDFGIEEVSISDSTMIEGGLKTVEVNRFERDKKIRDAYIKANGGICKCAICGFDFEATYGDIGKGFIHMHHKKPLSEIREAHKTKFEDLILVCPNCHSMLHRANPMLTPEKLKVLLDSNKKR